MNSTIVIGSMIFVASIIICCFVYYISLSFFPLLTRNLDLYNQMRRNNIAVSVVTGGFIVSVSIIIYVSSFEVFKLFRIEYTGDLAFTVLENVLRAIIMLVMSMFLSFLINWFALKAFSLITTGIDDMKELRNNNLAVSILIASMILMTTYMVIDPVSKINAAFVLHDKIGEYGIQLAFINLDLFIAGAIEFFLMLMINILLFSAGFHILNFVIKGVNEFTEFKKDNIAISLIVCSSIVAVIVMVKYSIIGEVNKFAVLIATPGNNTPILFGFLRVIYILIVSTFASILVLWGTMGIFILFSRMFDSVNEIRNRNVSTALILSFLTVSASFIMRTGVEQLINMIKFF